jgi:Spy/CpxP family protein refolding chaperone
VRSVGLKTEQQRRMDDVFAANRETLIKAFKSFQHEQGQLAKLARSRNLDEAAIFQQIDKVNAARSELEKATVHYQIALRKELTDEQNARLDDLRDTPKASDPQQ